MNYVRGFIAFLGSYIFSLFGFRKCFWPSISGKIECPILLVHGYLNSRFVWNFHGKRLQKLGFGPVYTVNLGWPFCRMEKFSRKIHRQVLKIQKETQRPDVILVGHSMGGLVSAYFAKNSAHKKNIRAIITLGTPFYGTEVAKIGVGSCSKQMRPNSSFIQDLVAWVALEREIPFYFLSSKNDALIIPYTSAIVESPMHEKRIVDELGHATLLFSETVNQQICQWLWKIKASE
jgi:triacylglycerol esterase/lipase EstA (alpha/beta hydrolase family)